MGVLHSIINSKQCGPTEKILRRKKLKQYSVRRQITHFLISFKNYIVSYRDYTWHFFALFIFCEKVKKKLFFCEKYEKIFLLGNIHKISQKFFQFFQTIELQDYLGKKFHFLGQKILTGTYIFKIFKKKFHVLCCKSFKKPYFQVNYFFIFCTPIFHEKLFCKKMRIFFLQKKQCHV